MIYPWNIIGHENQLLALEKEISQSSLTHAYFFHGPKDTGKFTVALLFAKILLCNEGLCHQCQDCRLVMAGTHPDFILMKDEGETIKIEDIRQLVAKANMTSQGSRRVVLIENAERMPIEAQNAFLKTLEEPPGQTIFLLTSSQPKNILPTILSRVRSYEFSLVEESLIKTQLIKTYGEADQLDQALEIAQGKPGLAIRLLSDSSKMGVYKTLFYNIEDLFKRNDLISKFEFVEELDKDSDQLELFFEITALLLRKAVQDFARNRKNLLVEYMSLSKINELFEKLMETRYLVSRNVNKKLALENFFLETEK